MEKKEINIAAHKYVPKHEKLNEEQANEVLKQFNISKKQLPVILKKDAAIKEMKLEKGDIIKIYRDSPTLGKSIFYRLVK
ncbi:DNA-directed RNA polymerase subunit H [archaeon]|nr:DNA-directed RNA polymerase subunit H [archaeon]